MRSLWRARFAFGSRNSSPLDNPALRPAVSYASPGKTSRVRRLDGLAVAEEFPGLPTTKGAPASAGPMEKAKAILKSWVKPRTAEKPWRKHASCVRTLY